MGTFALIGLLVLGTCVTGSPCQDGQRKLVKGTHCSMFQECQTGTSVLKICKPGYLFDSESLTCHHHSETKCLDDFSGCDEGSTYAHPHSCRIYYTCFKSRIVTKFCAAGEQFDPSVQSCRRGFICGNESSCNEGTRRSLEGLSSQYEQCVLGEWVRKVCSQNGIFDEISLSCKNEPNECSEGETKPINCHEYQSCKKGVWVLHSCPLGEVYDVELQHCKMGSCIHRNKRDTKMCNENERRRKEGSCKMYTECVDGEEVEKTCPTCMNFDDSKASCRYVFVAPCSNPPPPVPTVPTTPTPSTPVTEPSTPVPVPSTPVPVPSTPDPEPSTPAPEPSTPVPKPSTPVPEPSTPVTKPSTPVPKPSTPVPDPSTPVTKPSTPVPKPSTPVPDRSTPVPKPSTPVPVPSTPVPVPSTPVPVPSTPVPVPSTPVPVPSTSVPEPSTPVPKPSTPVPKPSTPVPKPSTPVPEPSTPGPEPSTTKTPETTSTEPNTSPINPKTTRRDPPPNPAPSTPPPQPSTQSTPTTVVPKCKDGERKAIPGECKKYLECVYGKFYTNQCNYFQHFDVKTLDCKVFSYTCP